MGLPLKQLPPPAWTEWLGKAVEAANDNQEFPYLVEVVSDVVEGAEVVDVPVATVETVAGVAEVSASVSAFVLAAPVAIVLLGGDSSSRELRAPLFVPAIDKPPQGLDVKQWLAEMEDAARIAVEVHSLQQKIRQWEYYGVPHVANDLRQQLEQLTAQSKTIAHASPLLGNILQAVATAGGEGDAPPPTEPVSDADNREDKIPPSSLAMVLHGARTYLSRKIAGLARFRDAFLDDTPQTSAMSMTPDALFLALSVQPDIPPSAARDVMLELIARSEEQIRDRSDFSSRFLPTGKHTGIHLARVVENTPNATDRAEIFLFDEASNALVHVDGQMAGKSVEPGRVGPLVLKIREIYGLDPQPPVYSMKIYISDNGPPPPETVFTFTEVPFRLAQQLVPEWGVMPTPSVTIAPLHTIVPEGGEGTISYSDPMLTFKLSYIRTDGPRYFHVLYTSPDGRKGEGFVSHEKSGPIDGAPTLSMEMYHALLAYIGWWGGQPLQLPMGSTLELRQIPAPKDEKLSHRRLR